MVSRLFPLFCLLVALPAWGLDSVTLQLNWKHQFQFAGYYAAHEKGFFREAGLEVRIVEAQEGVDPIASVLDGRAEFGVGASELALHRVQGEPVVALAVILQHSPLVLLASSRRIHSVQDLAAKRIMLMPHETELYAYLRRENIKHYEAVPHSFNPADLMEGKVDAISAYLTDEPFFLQQADFPYVTFTPRTARIDFYGDTLFTTESQAKRHPQRVKAFRAAALKGWHYAMAHPEEIADLIVARHGSRHSREHLLFEAREMARLMQPDLVEIGHMSQERWQQIADTYAELGMVPDGKPLQGLVFDAEPHPLPHWVVVALVAGSLGGLLVTLVAVRFATLNLRLRESEEKFRTLLESAAFPIVITRQGDGTVRYINQQAAAWFGLDRAAAAGRSALEAYVLPEQRERLVDAIARHDIVRDQEILLRREDGEHRWVLMTVQQIRFEGDLAFVSSFNDISERRAAALALGEKNEAMVAQLQEIERLRAALQEQAIRDGLTGMFNRRYLDEMLEREIARARREGISLSLVMLDADHFKALNDTYGHRAGDEALKAIAETLRHDIRSEDVPCRYGGEEFLILLPHMPLAAAGERAEQWRRAIEAIRVRFGEFELSLTASFGVAAYPDHGKTGDELTHMADHALYMAKRAGRNRVAIYDPQTEDSLAEPGDGPPSAR